MIGRLGVFVTAEKVRGRRRSFAARMEPIWDVWLRIEIDAYYSSYYMLPTNY
jgi:hypothetical protein